ncbi:magnesium transporter [Vibrio tubiashii]|uniref:magnesium transporter n=1 Tax=Vibrio tubiashii TaxID=29498 RepID=UPI001EFE52CC|nr:magnesium transporter [Vibrio tubiashii]MCG9581055.1 magnesium transporter [Vibrio tubiashii]MCG9614646.1 magnesium transporter [Vibrio tubiashii]MCG9689021.1 magnesium transporter [Vibrio tubiashii]
MTLITLPFSSEGAEKLYLKILECLTRRKAGQLNNTLVEAEPIELPSVLRKLSDQQRIVTWTLLSEVNPSLAANLLDHLSDPDLLWLISQLSESNTIMLFQYLHSADRRLLLNELPSDLQKQLRQALPSAWKDEEKAALIYPQDSAGGICKSEVLKLSEDATIDSLSTILNAEERSLDRVEWRYVYLHDNEGSYLGGLKIRDVLLLPRGVFLKEYIDDTVPVLSPDADLNTVKSTLDNTLHPVIPIVNEQGFQMGIVGFKHLNDALYQRSKQQMLEQSGVFGGDESRTMPVLKRNLRRLAFLLPSVALSYAAISIIAIYEPIIEQIAVLAAVLPLVANLSGAAGNQSVAVSIRELSMGQISAKDLLYVVAKEIPIGAINGLLIGTVLALLTLFTLGGEHSGLPLVIAIAYTLSSTLAVVIGGTLPLLLKRLKFDPAMLSSPMLTTLTDAISFFTVLYLAHAFLL